VTVPHCSEKMKYRRGARNRGVFVRHHAPASGDAAETISIAILDSTL